MHFGTKSEFCPIDQSVTSLRFHQCFFNSDIKGFAYIMFVNQVLFRYENIAIIFI